MKTRFLLRALSLLSFSFLTLSGAFAQSTRHNIEVGAFLSVIDLKSSVGEKPVGIGGRLGYQWKDHILFEGEFSHYPEDPSANFGQSIFLAGLKVGIRRGRLGGFVRFVPGMIHYGGRSFETYNGSGLSRFALGVGGILEYYPSSRVTLRVDWGDTIIPFGDTAIMGPLPPYTRQPGTTHNLQGSFGIGIRF